MKNIFKLFPAKNYKKVISSIGKYGYCIFEKEELLPGDIFRKELPFSNYNCVVGGTGTTLSNYVFTPEIVKEAQKIIIPKGEQVIVVRLLRFDDTHGEPHFNADDQMIFPTKEGHVFRFSRKDAPDHYLKISGDTNLLTVADAYKLPKTKHGPIEKYSEKGAKLHVEFLPFDDNIK